MRLLFCLLGLSGLCSQAQGNLALRSKAFNFHCTKQAQRKEFKINQKKVEGRKGFFTKENLESLLPRDLGRNDNGNSAGSKILRQSAQSIINSPLIQDTFLFKTAKKVEDSTKVEMDLKQEGRSPAQNVVDHKVNFDIQALKQEARLRYDGYINSKIEYRAANSSLEFSIEERLSSRSKIAISHTSDQAENRQLLQYQLTW